MWLFYAAVAFIAVAWATKFWKYRADRARRKAAAPPADTSSPGPSDRE